MLESTFGLKKPNTVYKERIGAYGIGFDSNDKIPVAMTHLYNGQKGYFLLGGGIDNGERYVDCIIRECMEEAGLSVIPKQFICKGDYYHYIEQTNTYFHGTGYFYYMEINGVITEPTEPDHFLVWLTVDELLGKTFRILEKTAEGTITEFLRDNEISTEELEEVAPLLKPDQLDDIFKHVKPGSLGELTSLAPFISQDVLDDVALKLAMSDEFPYICNLAPFLSGEAIEKLVKIIYDKQGFNALSSLFPFMSKGSLEKIADEEFTKTGIHNISSIAPFLCRSFLNGLAKEVIEREGIDAITPIIPFIDL